MRKKIITLIMSATLAASMSMTAFAGQWQQDTTGWWYQNDDGTYFNGGWQWIEGKCYYFTPEGYCLINTTTPDGYTVDGSGAWIVNGVVQTQNEEIAQTNNLSGYNSYGISNAAIDMLDSTKEENAVKYGVVYEDEFAGDIYIKYANGFEIQYYKESPYRVITQIPSDLLNGIDDNVSNATSAETNLRINGYTDTYNDGINAVTKINGYLIIWRANGPLIEVTKISNSN